MMHALQCYVSTNERLLRYTVNYNYYNTFFSINTPPSRLQSRWVALYTCFFAFCIILYFVIGKLSSYCISTEQTTSEGKKKIIRSSIKWEKLSCKPTNIFDIVNNIYLIASYKDWYTYVIRMNLNMWSTTLVYKLQQFYSWFYGRPKWQCWYSKKNTHGLQLINWDIYFAQTKTHKQLYKAFKIDFWVQCTWILCVFQLNLF